MEEIQKLCQLSLLCWKVRACMEKRGNGLQVKVCGSMRVVKTSHENIREISQAEMMMKWGDKVVINSRLGRDHSRLSKMQDWRSLKSGVIFAALAHTATCFYTSITVGSAKLLSVLTFCPGGMEFQKFYIVSILSVATQRTQNQYIKADFSYSVVIMQK